MTATMVVWMLWSSYSVACPVYEPHKSCVVAIFLAAIGCKESTRLHFYPPMLIGFRGLPFRAYKGFKRIICHNMNKGKPSAYCDSTTLETIQLCKDWCWHDCVTGLITSRTHDVSLRQTSQVQRQTAQMGGGGHFYTFCGNYINGVSLLSSFKDIAVL